LRRTGAPPSPGCLKSQVGQADLLVRDRG
jgi:hypothetical protein